jgi:NADPH:quinone reductase-like Zn-dependent oxidoreductase
MRAAYITELGPAGNIRVGDLPDPSPGSGDALVAVEASTVNWVDTFVRSGAWRTGVEFPFVVGRDLAGTVVDAGDTGFRAGERVWCSSLGYAGRQGAAAELAAVPSERLYPLPDGVPGPVAATMAHPASTAYLGLFTHGRMRPGETVAVLGAAGNVGAAMVVLAHRAGARVIAVCSRDDAEYCRSLGGEHALDYRDDALADRVRDVAPDGVGLCLDASGHNDLPTWLGLLAGRGRFVVLAGLRTRPVLPAGELYLMDRTVTGFAISQATTAELAEAGHHLAPLMAEGLLRPRRTEVLPLSEAAEAHRRLEEGHFHGTRVVLQVG